MCIFSKHVEDVSQTRIFVADIENGNHATVYEMSATIGEYMAMILPVPIVPGAHVKWVNLLNYPKFFDDLDELFDDEEEEFQSRGMLRGPTKSLKKLEVVNVGKYEASFVPTYFDLDRLDDRFRLSSETFNKLQRYKNFGFAVFKLKAAKRKEHFHPMAYIYAAARPDELFFPTLHIHDGDLESMAAYDHMLYTQLRGRHILQKDADWELADTMPTEAIIRFDRCHDMLVPSLPVERFVIEGRYGNADVVLRNQPRDIAHGQAKNGM